MRMLAGLIGTVLAAAVVVVVAWCAWALTARDAICAPGATALACKTSTNGLVIAIAVALTVVLPIASALFRARTSPRGSGLRALTYGLAGTAAGGALLFGALHDPVSSSTQAAAISVGAVLLTLAPIALFGGMISTLKTPAVRDPPPLSAKVVSGIPGAIEVLPPDASARGGGSPPPTMRTLFTELREVLKEREREEAAGR